jgi:predicted ATPase
LILKKLSIHNFKSLRNVTFEPGPLSVLVGANASGKTNFARAVQFLAEAYSIGLEFAVSRAGGYENIAYRRKQRSKEPIKFEIEAEGSLDEVGRSYRERPIRKGKRVLFTHQFSVNAVGSGIRAVFKVVDEKFRIYELKKDEAGMEKVLVVEFSREKNGRVKEVFDDSNLIYRKLLSFYLLRRGPGERLTLFGESDRTVSAQNLILEDPILRVLKVSFSSSISQFMVYQVSPISARGAGVPTPNPVLKTTGENLPALVDWLQSNYPERWSIVMAGMQTILPDLEEISVDYLHTKTLGLFFREEGVGRVWAAEDVSDGTILALSLLVASVDPRSSLILFDELENSLHPWVLRTIVERLRQVSEKKRVVITTHSPILVDLLRPEEIWVVYRTDGASHVEKLTDIDSSITESWKDGEYTLSGFLDSGFIGQAVPGGVF